MYGLAYAPGGRHAGRGRHRPRRRGLLANEGGTWHRLPGVAGCWAVAFADRVGWLVGVNGQILKVSF